MEQYLALDRGDTRRGVRQPTIEGNVDFEIKGRFLRELRGNTFSGNKNEDAHEHVGRIPEITSIFNTLIVSGDVIMLRVFPLTLTGMAKRWLYRALTEIINTLDLLKWIFILRFRPPSKTLTATRAFIGNPNSRGPIPRLTATRALVTIQEMADHSHKWHEEEGNRETGEYNSTRMSMIIDKLKSLSRDMRNHKENIHDIKGRYESGDEMYCISSEEVKCVTETKYIEDNLMATPGNNSPLGNNPKLGEILGKYLEESCRRKVIFDEWMKRFRENTDKNLRKHNFAIKCLEENVARLAQAVKTHNKINQDRTLDMKKSTSISSLSINSNLVRAVLQNELPPKEKDLGSFILPCIIGNTTVSNALADLGANISIMSFSMFKRLDFVILDIVEDSKVSIIIGRPMLATAHARIDVFGRKISMEVPKDFEESECLEEFLMNDDINGDLGDFLEENDLLPKIDWDTLEVLPGSDDEMGIRLQEMDNRDPRDHLSL
ncbi:hypothetical protein Tco_1118218 [Tanacetum coccineum]